MSDLKNKITAPQLFCLVFCYMLAGLRLHGGVGVAATLFVCLFCACVCVVCAVAHENCSSFAELCRKTLGRHGYVFRVIGTVLLALPFLASLWELAKGAASFYENGQAFAVLPVLVLLCVLAQSRGYSTLGRFAELCVFPLAVLLPLSLLGGGGEMPSFDLGQEDLHACFAAVGAVPVFFSLYLRHAKVNEQSDFARASFFQPSPVLCGVLAVFAAGLVHIFLIFTGAGSVLSSFLMWFPVLGRLFAFSLSVGDVLSLPESERMVCAQKIAVFAAVCAVVWSLSTLLSEAFGAVLAVGNVVFPCAVFAAVMLGQSYGRQAKEKG